MTGFNKNVLEIGTSTGYISKILKDRENTVTGIEIDPEAGLIAQNVCDRMIIGDVETLDFDTTFELQSFDVILCGDVLEHLKNPTSVLKKFHKILRPDGYLVVSLPNFFHGDVLLNLLNGDFHYTSIGLLDETHLRFFGQKNIYQLFADCGYGISDFTTTNRDVGTTELKVDDQKIPRNLFTFIKSLPNSTVYQYLFTAHPSPDIKVPPSDDPDLIHLVDASLEQPLHEMRSEYLKITGDLNSQILDLQRAVHDKNNELATKISEISRLQDNVSYLSSDLEQKKTEIEQKKTEITTLKGTLDSIQQSISWTILNKIQRGLNALFPAGKKRTKFYNLVIQGGRMLLHEGVGACEFTFREKIFKKIRSLRPISSPIISTTICGLSDNIPRSLDQPIKGIFLCPLDQLSEIHVFTATHIRKNSNLILRLREGSFDSPVIRTVQLPGSHIGDNRFSQFRFSSIPDSEGKKYCVELQSKPGPAAAIWFNPNRTTRKLQLYDDNGPVTGSIGFRCYSAIKIRDPYEAWILKNEYHGSTHELLTDDNPAFRYNPKISLITPVWNTDERWLCRAIESVISQDYGNWELCIVDGGSTKSHIKPLLTEYAAKEPRIKIRFLTENKGIAGNSNAALALATGDYVGFLDHDDELAPNALHEVVKTLNSCPDIRYLYSDEDKIDEKNRRCEPFFKPDWSPDMLLSCNYLCHFSVVWKIILDEIGGFQQGYDGSQDYDLFLRVTEKLKDHEIFHIPKILYHWRQVPESAAASTVVKPYAYIAAKKALTDSMARRNIKIEGVYDGEWTGSYRVKYSIPSEPYISIIIPTKDNVQILIRCLDSILNKTTYTSYEIVIVDNRSTKKETFDYYESLKDNPRIRLLHYDMPFNYSAINNYAVARVDSPYILFLNNDTEVISEEWLSAMLEHAQRDNVGAVGAKLLYPNNTIQHAGIILGIIGYPPIGGHSHRFILGSDAGYCGRVKIIQDVSAVTAACLMMKREIFNRIGGFDEKLAIAFNDVDLCLKIRQQNKLIIYTPFAQLYHHESLSRGFDDTPDKKKRFIEEVLYIREKWGDLIDKGDPYYNSNLTRDKEDFSIN